MEHQETECNTVLAGGKVTVKFCVAFFAGLLGGFFGVLCCFCAKFALSVLQIN